MHVVKIKKQEIQNIATIEEVVIELCYSRYLYNEF